MHVPVVQSANPAPIRQNCLHSLVTHSKPGAQSDEVWGEVWQRIPCVPFPVEAWQNV